MARSRSTTTRKPAVRKRQKQLTIWVDATEATAFREKANASGMPLTTWVRVQCRRAVGLETP